MDNKLNIKICEKCDRYKGLTLHNGFYFFNCFDETKDCCVGTWKTDLRNKNLDFHLAIKYKPKIYLGGDGFKGCKYELEQRLYELNRKKRK